MNAEHTKGPWFWEVNPASKSIDLRAATPPFGTTVMDFTRWGMQSAQPRFNVGHVMKNASDLSVVDPARDHHKDWHQLLEHPDARLIAAAPDLLEILSVAIYEAERGRLIMAEANKEMGFDEPKKLDWVVRAKAAIAKATQTPTPQ